MATSYSDLSTKELAKQVHYTRQGLVCVRNTASLLVGARIDQTIELLAEVQERLEALALTEDDGR